MSEPVRRILGATLLVALVLSVVLVESSTGSLSAGESRSTQPAPPDPPGYGALRVEVVIMNDSAVVASHPPITIRRDDVRSGDRLLFYAPRGGPVEVELPANADYLVGVPVTLFPVGVRVRILTNQLANLTIWVNLASRRATLYGLEDTDSTGRVAGWSDIFVHTRSIATPETAWNTTILLVKSGLAPPAPYSEANLVQTEAVPVSITGVQTNGDSLNLRLRSPGTLRTSGIEGVYLLAFESHYRANYVTSWMSSGRILRELIEDGTSSG